MCRILYMLFMHSCGWCYCKGQYDWTMCAGAQNIDGCTFEEDSCGFDGVNWMRKNTSTTGLHYDNTFRTAFGESVGTML